MPMNLSFRHKIIALATLSALLPVLAAILATLVMETSAEKRIDAEMDRLTRETIAHVCGDIYRLCRTTNRFIQDEVAQAMVAAQTLLAEGAGVRLVAATIEWRVRDEDGGEEKTVTLPALMVNGSIVRPNKELVVPSPVVDRVHQLTGVPCTIYQRMNEQGDMLRVASSVVSADGAARGGVGLYTRIVEEGSSRHQVLERILDGRAYRGFNHAQGRDWVVEYAPITGEEGEIVGMLGVGLVVEEMESLRQTVLSTNVGETGYVWVMGGQGASRGRYIISKGGERDGESILEAVDAEGEPFIRSIAETALEEPPGKISFKRYPWRNPGEKDPRMKISAFTYFPDWDWVIGVGMYEDDYYAAKEAATDSLHTLIAAVAAAGLLILAAMVGLAVYAGSRMTAPLGFVTSLARKVASGDVQGAQQAIQERDDLPDEDKAAVSRDEAVVLLDSFRGMTGSLNALLAQVRKSGIQVKTSATQIAASASQIEGTFSQQAASTSQVGASTREISSTASELAQSMTEMNASTTETARLAAHGQDGIDQIKAVMEELHGATSFFSDKLTDISDKAGNIGEIVMTITKVANQTNMLSLNAAIEAEKAGEYGLGFSVVAREIRRLADQTAVATLDIEEMVGQMQRAVSSGVETMERFTGQVTDGAVRVADISTSLAEVIERIMELGPRFEGLNESVQSQSEGAGQISEAMAHLSETAEQTRQTLAEFKDAADQLNEAVQGLHNEVSRFTVG